MSHVSRDKVIGACAVGAFQKDIVIGIGAGVNAIRDADPETRIPNGLKCACDNFRAALESRTADDLLVFGENVAG